MTGSSGGYFVMLGPYDWEDGFIPVIHYDSAEFSDHIQCIPEGIFLGDEVQIRYEIAYDRGKPLLYLKIYPLRKAQDGISAEVLMQAGISIEGIPDDAAAVNYDTRQMRAAHSVLSGGHWYKMRVHESGIYMIDHSRFVAMGFPSSVVSDHIRIFGNGGEVLPESNAVIRPDDLTENAILIDDGGDGMFDNASDKIIFYGEGTKLWKFSTVSGEYSFSANPYDTLSAYFITVIPGQGLRINDFPPVTGVTEKDIFNYDYLCNHERNDVNLLHSGREWLGEDFRLQPVRNFQFDVPGITDTLPARISVGFVARSFQPSTLDIVSGPNSLTLNIPKTDAGQNTDYAKEAIAVMDVYPAAAPLSLQLTYNITDPNALAWLNYIRITAGAALNFTAPFTIFRAAPSFGASVVTYHLGNVHPQIQIWDITNPLLPQRVSATITGNTAVFKSHGDVLRSFIAFDDSEWLTPTDGGVVQPQDLHGMPTPDYIIIAHEEFLAQAEKLADFHRQHNDLETIVVSTEQVYNEFSSGKKDVAALRDFVRMFYERESDPEARPRYLLLFGDGSYDPLERIQPHSDFVPTYQTLNSYTPTASYVTDDFFALLDPLEGQNAAGLPDIGVGRLTVKSVAEADLVVEKIKRYSATHDLTDTLNQLSGSPSVVSNFGGWRNNLSFIADDEDGNLHMKQADGISAVVDSLGYGVIEKLYFDAFKQYATPQGPRYPDVNDAIRERVRKGALIINYTGHGGETGWASENVLGLQDIFSWTNYFNLPVFVTATCEFSRYDDPQEVSAGEHILLHEKGGGIALFSTTRVAYAHSNEIINRFLLKSLFTVTDGKYPTMGDAIRRAKVMCGTGVYMQNFTLLGDPALKLACPAYRVITDSINRKTAAGFSDTVSNGQTITVSGHIEDFSNVWRSDFSGIIELEVYDKASQVTTLANDFNNAPYSFYTINTLLFRGKAKVESGIFSFSFVLPSHLSYSPGYCRFSYYAVSSETDASGRFEGMTAVHNGSNQYNDTEGPVLNMYLNNTDFKSGDAVTNQPLLIALAEDMSGVNFWNAGIGRSMKLIIDGDLNHAIDMEEYYHPNPDERGKGTIIFRMPALSYGEHSARLVAWDVLGNSAESEISFIIEEPTEPRITALYNYPDPFIHSTTFYIEHNLSQTDMYGELSVYNLSGLCCAVIPFKINAGDFPALRLLWNGRAINGQPTSKGMYIYTVRLCDDKGRCAQMSEKLMNMK